METAPAQRDAIACPRLDICLLPAYCHSTLPHSIARYSSSLRRINQPPSKGTRPAPPFYLNEALIPPPGQPPAQRKDPAMHAIGTLLIVSGLGLFAATPTCAAQSYKLTDLGALGGTQSYADAI